jgi:hypothetical protein
MLELDHLVIAATDLDAGEAWLRERLGTALAPGGRHPGWGTHNRLLQLGGRVYLELIAVDPSAPAPAAPRPFGLDDPALRERLRQSPQLVHWLVRSSDLVADLAALDYPPGPVAAMTRGTLRWRITVPTDGRPAGAGLLPSVIAWDVPLPEQPPSRLPDVGVRLAGLAVHGPEAVIGRRPAVAAPVPIDWIIDTRSALAARFETPLGPVTLAG